MVVDGEGDGSGGGGGGYGCVGTVDHDSWFLAEVSICLCPFLEFISITSVTPYF